MKTDATADISLNPTDEARHMYLPTVAGDSLTDKVPSWPRTVFRSPFLNHVYSGSGLLSTSQVNCTSCPNSQLTSTGFWVNLGGSVAIKGEVGFFLLFFRA